jgi:hypothetical protein
MRLQVQAMSDTRGVVDFASRGLGSIKMTILSVHNKRQDERYQEDERLSGSLWDTECVERDAT